MEKFKDMLQKCAGYVAVAFVSAIYIATAFIQIDETGKSVARIIADGAIVFILGVFINQIFDLQGIANGERDERFRATVALHGQTVVEISPYIDDLDEFCQKKNEENLRLQRTRLLATQGMRYDDYFDPDGSAKGFILDENSMKYKETKRLELKRLKYYEKAVRLKLTLLSAGELTSEGTKSEDPYDFGRDKEQYHRQVSMSDVISKIGTALIFGYYSASLIENFSYAALIWNVLQVAIFILMGIIRMNSSEMFITDEYRGRIVKKINILEMFKNQMQPDKKKKTEEK